jgi:microcystin degradation protein MlrC
VATFDYHANLSDALVEACDVLVGYETFPHVDMAERGREAARILGCLIEAGERPVKAFRKLPLLWPPLLQVTGSPPMSEVMAVLREVKTTAGIMSASVAAGFPWADVEHLGTAAIVYGEDRHVVRDAADSLADAIWSRRHAGTPDLVPAETAIAMALASEGRPVVLVDAADNVGGGAPGDGTHVLSALLAATPSSAVIMLHDPESVEAVGSGGGARFDAWVGGKTDDQHGPPVRLRGEVEFYGDVDYVRDGTYMTGQRVHMGHVAVVNSRGIRVVLTEERVMPFDDTHLRVVGIEPEKQDIIVVKSLIAWQAAFGSIASAHYVVDSPGICAVDLFGFEYTCHKVRLFPFDPDAAWPNMSIS